MTVFVVFRTNQHKMDQDGEHGKHKAIPEIHQHGGSVIVQNTADMVEILAVACFFTKSFISIFKKQATAAITELCINKTE